MILSNTTALPCDLPFCHQPEDCYEFQPGIRWSPKKEVVGAAIGVLMLPRIQPDVVEDLVLGLFSLGELVPILLVEVNWVNLQSDQSLDNIFSFRVEADGEVVVSELVVQI